MIKNLRKYYYSISRLNILFFISGILAGLLIYFRSESNYEDTIFETLASHIVKESRINDNINDDSILFVNSLHVVHNSLKDRQGLFDNIKGIKAGIIHPLTVDLMTANGACGSYALVLARLIKELGYEVRIVQMKVNGVFGGHILVEARTDNNWVVLDPSYDLHFKRPDGKFASFEDVHTDWNFYKQQVPSNYDLRYNYEGLRYTNWHKIPVLTATLKKILDWTIGKEQADTFSFRIVMLRKFYLFFVITLVLQFYIVCYMIYYVNKKRKRANHTIDHSIPNDVSSNSPQKVRVKIVKTDSIEQVENQDV